MEKMDDVKKVAVVTGGSRGIGRAISLKLIEEGMNVVTCYNSDGQAARELEQISSFLGNGIITQADVTCEHAVIRLVSRCMDLYGRIDVLVNNAGIQSRDVDYVQYDVGEWNEIMVANVTSAFLLCKHVIPKMLALGGGKIVNVSSVAGLSGSPKRSSYAASKSALIGFTCSLAKELAKQNIRVNAILPGLTNTSAADGLTNEAYGRILAQTPIGRVAEPEDIADVVAFLCSDRSRYITGSCIPVTGGR